MDEGPLLEAKALAVLEAFRDELIEMHGSIGIAWRLLLDPNGRGLLTRRDWMQRCEEQELANEDDAALLFLAMGDPNSDRLYFDSLESTEAAGQSQPLSSALSDLAAAVFERGGAPEVFRPSRSCERRYKVPSLDLEEFMHVCLDLDVNCSDYRALFDFMDPHQRGFVTVEDLLFLDSWQQEPAGPRIARSRDQLAQALDGRSSLTDRILPLARAAVDETKRYGEQDEGWRRLLGLALVQAAERGRISDVEELLDLGADPRLSDEKGRSPLHAAVGRPSTALARSDGSSGSPRRGTVDVTRLVALLLAASAPIDAWCDREGSPLHVACHAGHVEVVATLCHLRADVKAIHRRLGSPLMLCATEQRLDVSKVLMAALADPCRMDIHECTPILKAAESQQHDLIEAMQDHVKHNYKKLFTSTLQTLYPATDIELDKQAEVQKVVANMIFLAKAPCEGLADAANAWREAVLHAVGSCSWPKARAAQMEQWPNLAVEAT